MASEAAARPLRHAGRVESQIESAAESFRLFRRPIGVSPPENAGEFPSFPTISTYSALMKEQYYWIRETWRNCQLALFVGRMKGGGLSCNGMVRESKGGRYSAEGVA